MRRILLTCVLVLGLVLIPGAASAGSSARVRLTAMSPAAVHGWGFHGRERVVVTVRSGSTKLVGAITSSSSGAFTMRFAHGLRSGGCAGFSITAVGAQGDRAAWKSPPPSCGTELAP